MEITGKIIQKLTAEGGTSARGTWKKQAFIIETQDQFPKKVCIHNWNDKVALDNFAIGSTVKASINVESREFNGKWYTDVTVWRLDAEGASSSSSDGAYPPPPTDLPMPSDEPSGDDLPF